MDSPEHVEVEAHEGKAVVEEGLGGAGGPDPEELVLVVAAQVAVRRIGPRVQRLVLRHHTQHAPARPEHAAGLARHARVVGDVLEHVDEQDGVEALVAEGQVLAPADDEGAPRLAALARRLDALEGRIVGDDPVVALQHPAQVARAAAEVEHVEPLERRADFADDAVHEQRRRPVGAHQVEVVLVFLVIERLGRRGSRGIRGHDARTLAI